MVFTYKLSQYFFHIEFQDRNTCMAMRPFVPPNCVTYMNKIQEEIFEKERCEFELELRYKISWIILQEWIVLLFMVAWTIKFLNV